MKLGVFGGSFDPPHLSHVAVCAFTLALTDVDEVLVVPCFEHAFAKDLSRFKHRLRMCELAFGDLRRTVVSDVERSLGGTSFTQRTLEHLAAERPGVELALVVGADALRDRRTWYRFDRIQELAGIIAVGREGVDLPVATLLPAPPGMSATEIRARIARGEPVDGLVPRSVLQYVVDHDLYRSAD